jgi:RNA polymerase primary sigma factor
VTLEGDDADAVAIYLRELASVEPVSTAEETELFRRLGASDNWDGEAENVARRLIESYLRVVVPIAERHSAISGIAPLDLIQEGNIGLFNAVKAFAKKPSGEFSAYAMACIEDAILKAVAESKQR